MSSSYFKNLPSSVNLKDFVRMTDWDEQYAQKFEEPNILESEDVGVILRALKSRNPIHSFASRAWRIVSRHPVQRGDVISWMKGPLKVEDWENGSYTLGRLTPGVERLDRQKILRLTLRVDGGTPSDFLSCEAMGHCSFLLHHFLEIISPMFHKDGTFFIVIDGHISRSASNMFAREESRSHSIVGASVDRVIISDGYNQFVCDSSPRDNSEYFGADWGKAAQFGGHMVYQQRNEKDPVEKISYFLHEGVGVLSKIVRSKDIHDIIAGDTPTDDEMKFLDMCGYSSRMWVDNPVMKSILESTKPLTDEVYLACPPPISYKI